MSQFDSSTIRQILTDMPKARYQDPKIRQNKNGSYYVRPWVDILTPSGLIRRKKTIVLGPVALGKRAAGEKKREVMATVNQASSVVQCQIPFGQLLTDYKRLHVSKLEYSTQLKYESHIKTHIEPAFGKLMLCEITTLKIQAWLDGLNLSPTTKYDLKGTLSGIFKKAADWNYWDERNPVERVYLGRKELLREKRKLTIAQMQQIFHALPPLPSLVVKVALFGTLRVSEVLGLQEKHLDIARRVVMVRQRFYRGNTSRTKSEKSTRDVGIGLFMDELQALCTGDPERYIFRSHPTCKDDCYIRCTYLTPAAKSLGIYYTGFGFHSFRREAVTEYGKSDPAQTLKMAGHAKFDMSLLYTLQDSEAQSLMVNAHMLKLQTLHESGDNGR